MAIWQLVKKVPVQHPFAFGIGVSTVKTSISDLLVQKVVEQREDIDWKRNLAFATFGFFYLGGIQYTLYVPVFGRIFSNASSFAAKSLKEKMKDGKGLFSLCGQVFLDQMVHHPFMYFPAFYVTKELVMHEKPDVWKALNEYKNNMTDDLLALWKIWVPSTFVNFAFMPMWARIPWVAGTSLLWTCVLSSMRGGSISDSEEIAGGAITGATFHMVEDTISDFFASPVELDSELSHLCLSAMGPDTAGWVAMLAREVADNKGNITHSNMVRFGSDFVITMHVSVKPAIRRKLVSSLLSDERLEPLNLKVTSLQRRRTGKYIVPKMGIRIHCHGADRPGMLAVIADKIYSQGLSIENITTTLNMGKKGCKEFVVNADCVTGITHDKSSLDKMIAEIMKLKKELQLNHMNVSLHKL